MNKFNQYFSKATKISLTTDTIIGNGTWYFDPLQKHYFGVFSEEDVMATTCPDTNRRILIVGHGPDMEPSIIFERYEGKDIIFGNINNVVQSFTQLGSGKLSEEMIDKVMAFRSYMLTHHETLVEMAREKIKNMSDENWPNLNSCFWVKDFCPEFTDEIQELYQKLMDTHIRKKVS